MNEIEGQDNYSKIIEFNNFIYDKVDTSIRSFISTTGISIDWMMYEWLTLKTKEKLIKEYSDTADKQLYTKIIELIEKAKSFFIFVDDNPFSPINEIQDASKTIESDCNDIIQEVYLYQIKKHNSVEHSETTDKKTISPIVWNGNQADLTRIFKDLRDARLINISGRDFSQHFCLKDGKSMPPDFQESLTYKQGELSRNPAIQKIQGAIRGMEPESGE